MTLVKKPLAQVAVGTIIRHKGYWGVVIKGPSRGENGSRRVDFWDKRPEKLARSEIVEVLIEK